ncbi:MAG: OsmC family protein [Prolixibacteraceae bacterium]|jgi:putative redox protein|nr:OsmC family protein [Prolixibacteraceae bacterium]MBT6766673.1 OsmC family protein [Prolixibacteraceae bacterium]MBT6997449.1 OsmC family protein [Prolixibacteraceae bacterium]MBT7396067.1 OsmC family protein [Prolixibacteraceae bacterium]
MAKETVNVEWLENMAFKAEVNGHEIVIDAGDKVGGENRGPRPKPFMLTALAGCTGMDVVSILKKMRVKPDYFNVVVEGELTEEHPKHFIKMHVIYEFRGKDLPMAKLQKAIDLSEERYCGVSATYKQSMELTSEIKILN